MRADRINIDKFHYEHILECRGRKAFNEHGCFMIRGIIRQELEEEYFSIARAQSKVRVTVTGENGEEVNLFHGILYGSCFRHENGVVILQIQLRTGSCLADVKRHIRSFQEDNTDYRSIAEECLRQYKGGASLLGRITPTVTEGFLMQYEETDWEFLKRLVSMSHSVLLADDETGEVKLYMGIPNFGAIHELNSDCYKVHGNFNQFNQREEDFLVYEVEAREVYKVGEKVRFDGKSLIICAMVTNLEGSELVHTYYLMPEPGVAAERTYHSHLAGNSITARVTEVVRDKVKVDIDMDENVHPGKRLFPYATVYSTPDGTGWYCMPEIGDKVRLTFPTAQETDAYVESSVHLQGRENPEEKSMMNRQRKEILFTPNSLILRNNNGISIELLDEEGIKIVSDKSIILEANDTIRMDSSSGEIEMSAAKSIGMRQGNAQLEIADKITMTGGKINLN